MFPIAMTAGAIADRVLQADDIAGISDLYPGPPPSLDTGGIVGRVTKNGQGVDRRARRRLQSRDRHPGRQFHAERQRRLRHRRLPPGPYILRVEPLDDADPESFFPAPIDADFRVTYAPRMVVAPHGGSSPSIEIRVLPK